MSATLALSDGRAGNARQARALAEALDADARTLELQPRAPWRWLAPHRLPGSGHAFGTEFTKALVQPPALAIGCGRQAALATRLLRARGSKVVQVLDPRIDPRHWDVVIAPEHDGLRGDNIVSTLGSLHPVDDLWLARARQAFPALGDLPSPRTLLLVGGPSKHAALRDSEFDALLQRLAALATRARGSFSAIASRRTPQRWREALARIPVEVPGARWRDARDGENPYAGMLAWADRIVCTPDSVNMLSEAAATLAPMFVWAPERVHGRLRGFLAALRASGRMRDADDAWQPFDAEPLRETARVAALLRQRLDLAP